MSAEKTVGAFILGACAGAVAALLFAPKTGEETRKELAKFSKETADKMEAFAKENSEKLAQLAKENTQKLEVLAREKSAEIARMAREQGAKLNKAEMEEFAQEVLAKVKGAITREKLEVAVGEVIAEATEPEAAPESHEA